MVIKYLRGILLLLFVSSLLSFFTIAETFSVDPCGSTSITSQGNSGNAEWVYGNKCIQITMRKNNYDSNIDINDLHNKRTFKLHLYGVDERDYLGNTTSYPFASMNLKSDISQGYLRYNNSDISIGYLIKGNTLKTIATLSNLPKTYTTGSDYWLKINYKKNAQDIVSWIPVTADNNVQQLVLENKTVGQNFFVYQKMGSTLFNLFEIDPIYVVDYSPVPATLLINGDVDSDDDSAFPSLQDVTSGVSDNSSSTQYGTYKHTFDFHLLFPPVSLHR